MDGAILEASEADRPRSRGQGGGGVCACEGGGEACDEVGFVYEVVAIKFGVALDVACKEGTCGTGGGPCGADQIRTNDFDRSIRLITQDDDAYWCGQADGQIINSQAGSKFCAIHMPSYVEPEVPEAAE